MTIKDIITQTKLGEVLKTFEYYYGNSYSETVKSVYLKLKKITPQKNKRNMIVFIRVLKENEQGDDVVTNDFDVNDKTLFFDICGEDNDYNGLYSISSEDYDQLLGYYISEETIKQFHFSQIIAHLLWEIEWR
ncbi:MAG: hypothetical protein E7397_08725 [Ruminococcaceae bacterium]|nr:hypothetical protein [Oscillospiraceae bacterium]